MFATYDITLFLKIVKAAFCEKKKMFRKGCCDNLFKH